MTSQAPRGRTDVKTLMANAAREIAERDAVPQAAPSRKPRPAATRPAAARPVAPRPPARRAAEPARMPDVAPAAFEPPPPPPQLPAPPQPQQAPAWQPQAQGPAPGPTGQGPSWSPPPPQYPPQQSAPVAGSKADSAFVLGIISIFLNVFYVPGILAIVWGGRERHQSSKARTGFVCGIIGTTLSVLATLLFVLVFAVAGNAVNEAADSLAVTDNASPAMAAGPTKASYNVGDTATTGDFRVTVYGFKDPQPPASEFMTPRPGMHYVSVDVQMTNPDPKEQQSFSSLLGFHLIDGQNRQYNEDFMDAGLTPGAPGGEIAAGQSVRGYVAFEVPDGTSGLKLRVQGNLTAAGAVFNLG